MMMTLPFSQQDKIIDLTQRRLERALMREYALSLKTIRSLVAELFEKYADNKGKLTLFEVSKYNRLAGLEKAIAREMGKLSGKQSITITKTIKEVYQESFYRTAFILDNAVRDEYAARLLFSQLPVKQIEAAILNPYDRIGWPTRSRLGIRTATRKLQEAVTQGIIQGKSYVETARELKTLYDKTAYEALRIVQTESHRAREQGRWSSYDQAEQQGLNLTKFWVSTTDALTRDMHQDMDGREAELVTDPKDGEVKVVFTLPDGAVGYPGNTGEAQHDINCRCTTRSEIGNFKPKTRRVRMTDEEYNRRLEAADGDKSKVSRSEVVPYKDYNQWAHDNGLRDVV